MFSIGITRTGTCSRHESAGKSIPSRRADSCIRLAWIINVIHQEHPSYLTRHARVIHEAEQAFIAESKIIDWIVGDLNEPGLNADILKEFIKSRINASFKEIGFPQPFELNEELVAETIWFEETLLGNTSTDFFHSRPVEYAKKNKSFDEKDLF